jgi:FkbM family methyltransferase
MGEALGRRGRLLLGETSGGSPIWLSARDHQHRHLYFFREYEPDVTALFQRLVRPGSTVYDVGANAGYFTLLAHELGASVHAFEPHPIVTRLLERSVALQRERRGRITVVPAACSERSELMRLFLGPVHSTGMSSVEKPGLQWADVPGITLDDYSRRVGHKPDLVKIDVEGHELEVLRGAIELLREARPVVIVETEKAEVLDLMSGLDYEPRRVLASGSLTEHDGSLELAARGYENVCFLPA